jgi:hypothetical protein
MRNLRTAALVAAVLAGTAGLALAQGVGKEGATSPGGAVTEGPGRAGNAGLGGGTPSAVTGTNEATSGKMVKHKKTARRHTRHTTGSSN